MFPFNAWLYVPSPVTYHLGPQFGFYFNFYDNFLVLIEEK